MLAPRKTLWSTPDQAVEAVIRWISLDPNDVVCDIGCGDGRVLLQWAAALSSTQPTMPVSFIGLELDEDRARQAQENVREAQTSGKISPHITITIYCANALEGSHLYRDATVFFLYLIPRGLRLIRPILNETAQARGKAGLKVVTYMSPLPDESFVAKELCTVPHQPGAAWPLYMYHLRKGDAVLAQENATNTQKDL